LNSNTKIIIFIVVLFIIIIFSGTFTINYLKNTAESLELTVNGAIESVTNKQWSYAQKQLEEFNNTWDSTKYYWAMLVDHFEVDNIDDCFTKTRKYVESEDYSSSLAELEALKYYIRHIPEKEGFTLKNIF